MAEATVVLVPAFRWIVYTLKAAEFVWREGLIPCAVHGTRYSCAGETGGAAGKLQGRKGQRPGVRELMPSRGEVPNLTLGRPGCKYCCVTNTLWGLGQVA